MRLRRTLYSLLMWNRCCISIRFIPPLNPFFCTRSLCWSTSFPFYGRKRLNINMQTFTQYACTSSSVMDVHGKAKLSKLASHVSAKTKMRWETTGRHAQITKKVFCLSALNHKHPYSDAVMQLNFSVPCGRTQSGVSDWFEPFFFRCVEVNGFVKRGMCNLFFFLSFSFQHSSWFYPVSTTIVLDMDP